MALSETEELELLQLQKQKASVQEAQKPPIDWRQVIGSSAKGAFTRPAAFAKDLGTNPVTMANAMPAALGTLGGASPVPGGGTMGTAAGQGIRDLALVALKKPVPSGMQHAGELGLSVLGDAVAIPKMKSAYFGSKIGEAEKAFPGMADVVKEAPPSQARTAVKLAQQLKGQDLSPLEAKRFQPAMSSVYEKGIPFQKAFKQYSSDFQGASSAVSKGLNKIPGRAEPAAAMAKAMTVPNALRDARQAIWQNPVLRRLIYAVLTGAGIGEGAKLTGLGPK